MSLDLLLPDREMLPDQPHALTELTGKLLADRVGRLPARLPGLWSVAVA